MKEILLAVYNYGLYMVPMAVLYIPYTDLQSSSPTVNSFCPKAVGDPSQRHS